MSHSKLSPSSMARWSRCPGYPSRYVELLRKGLVKDVAKPASAIGTAVHKMIELYFEEGTNPESFLGMSIDGSILLDKKTDLDLGAVTDNMAESANVCIQYMEELRGSPDLLNDEYEKFYSTSSLEIEGLDGGTCDGIFEFANKVMIVDYKNGGYPVYAKDNSQLLCYAAGHYLNANRKYRKLVEEYILVIVQPNARKANVVDPWVISTDNLDNWIELELIPSAEATVNSAELIPGDIQCKWCLIGDSGLCGAQADLTKELIQSDFDTIDVEPLPDVETLSIDQLVKISEYETIIKSFLDNAKKRLRHLALVDKVPRHKWVLPKTNRKFIDDIGAIGEEISKYGVNPFVQKKVTRGMGEIENELKTKLEKDEIKEVMAKVTFKPKGAPVLVLETDKRKEVESDIKSDFADFM